MVLGVVSTVKVLSKSFFLAIIVVISATVILLTSSPSTAVIRSPGCNLSTRTDEDLTPDITVPFVSNLLARMIPNLPGGAMIVILLLRDACCWCELFWEVLRDDLEVLPTECAPLYDPKRLPRELPEMELLVLFGLTLTLVLSVEPTMANCISSLNKSFATDRLASDMCDKCDLVDLLDLCDM